MTNTITLEKVNALKDYLTGEGWTDEELNEAPEMIYNDVYDCFEICGQEYKVLTDEEADQEARDEIENSLWAFRAGFILEHTRFYSELTPREVTETIKALEEMQGKLCESANPIIKSMISDPEDFIYDAIEADGRGHFIAWYDFEENEQNGFYIYRVN